jgi:hypothetical protein
MIAPKGMGPGSLARSYNVKFTTSTGKFWSLTIDNTAKSKSKWSPGFDYPSALHQGWGPYTVRPRNGMILAIPVMGAQTKKGFKVGSYKSKVGGGFGSKFTYHAQSAGVIFAMETHPKGAPPRPHIRFYGMDVLELADRTVLWALEAKKK